MKSKNRVKGYKEGTKDFEARYNMLLDDGVVCGDCKHNERCKTLFGGNDLNTECQFYPNRFIAKQKISMCDCRKQINQKVSETLGKEGSIVNYEMISGRTYSIFEYQDGKRKKQQLILHTYCPTCGKKYEE
jgi:hypothetical protein